MARQGTTDLENNAEYEQFQCDTCGDVVAVVNSPDNNEPLSPKGECGRCTSVSNDKKLAEARAGLQAFEEYAENFLKSLSNTRDAELRAGNNARAQEVERSMGQVKLLYSNYVTNTSQWRKQL